MPPHDASCSKAIVFLDGDGSEPAERIPLSSSVMAAVYEGLRWFLALDRP